MSVLVSLRLSLGAAVLGVLCAGAALAAAPDAPAEAAPQGASDVYVARGKSGLPLPRFVSLKSAKVNSRIGPGVTYAVDWRYLKAGLPMEIIQEYDNWRRVRDADGAEGWINQSLLSAKRTAIAAPWQKGKKNQINLLEEAREKSAVVAIVEPGVIGQIQTCNGEWCEVSFAGHAGWMKQALLWGAYPGEIIGD